MASLSLFLPSTNLRLAVSASAASCDPNSKDASRSGGKRSWWGPPIIEERKKGAGDGGCSEHGAEEEERAMTTRRSSSSSAMLTAEKARVLRKEMRSTETWHDAMYHSAIASRLASPDDE